METVIVYKSKTGFTEKYAKWIGEEISCEAINIKQVTSEILKPYKTVIYGGGIMAGQISGLKKFKMMMSSYPEKKIIVFATGATPAEEVEKTSEIRNANFSEEDKQKIPLFYLQSGINYEGMNVGGKLIMKMFASMLSKKKDMSPEEQGMAATIQQSCDFSDRENIVPLVNYTRGKV